MYQGRRIRDGKDRGAISPTSLKSSSATFFFGGGAKNLRKRWILSVEAKIYIVQLTKGITKNQKNQHAVAFCLFACLFLFVCLVFFFAWQFWKLPLSGPLLKWHPHTTFRPTPTPLCIDAARSNWFLLISHLIYSPLLSIWVFTTGVSGNNNRFAVMKSVLVSAWSN